MTNQDKAAERGYYDRLFTARGRFDQLADDRLYEEVAEAARAGSPQGRTALDLGCGAGTQSACLRRLGFAVASVDLSLPGAALCRASARGAPETLGVVNADAERLPFVAGAFDACTCSLFLHHFRSLDAVAVQLARVLRPGAVVVATDANAHNPFSWLFFNLLHRLRPMSWITPDQRAISCREIARSFAAHGFGEFRFRAVSTELRRDWLGDSLAFELNFQLRRGLLAGSRLLPWRLARGNVLVSQFRRVD